ncbi:succinate dehydrogenase [ubiquinone] cytochrome b small subunit A, mitochondrial-like [Daphnia magna]|uniref:Succinate dehydrogenase [ubiquinone] cytochrome b small subunit n=2 Tax=Daphnia magna TaxID=35525 RepID=A0A162QNI0_9CRUS|nr:succinate dehydrogenase [ubiquinone] cytochrome b small subunit A, mitochondrial-like [Daphnia magna]KAK4009887.1 hypothetical protein OUZ56_019030 [Daphnia magna]KZS19824.1 Succinate dehydrogenase cytochrome B small subunit [Daphnia magna]
MAAMMSLCRNFGKVGLSNRMTIGNPCLAALSNRNKTFLENRIVPSSQNGVKKFTVNHKALAETSSCKSADDHTRLWTIERSLALSLVPLVPSAFMFPSAAMDYLLAISFTLHAHWGLETIVVDYLRPKVVGPALAKLGVALVYGISAFTLGGLFYFNYSDVGIVNAIKMLWKL